MTQKGLSGKMVKNCSAVLHKALSVVLKQGSIVKSKSNAKLFQRKTGCMKEKARENAMFSLASLGAEERI